MEEKFASFAAKSGCEPQQGEKHAREKHRHVPVHQVKGHLASAVPSVDVDNASDEAGDAARPGQPVSMQMVQNVHRGYKFEQMVVSKLREPGKVVCEVQLGDLNRLRYVVPQYMSTTVRGDPVEG